MRQPKLQNTRFLAVLAAVMLFALAATASHATAAGGGDLFVFHCAVCHSFRGQGGGMGPDLTAVANRLSGSDLIAVMDDPLTFRNQSRMPSFRHLPFSQKQAIADFLSR